MKQNNGEDVFYQAPRYLFRKYNILRLIGKHYEIKKFLDIGCGAGELACTLAQNGLVGIGTDFSDQALNTAKHIRKSRRISEKSVQFIKGGIPKRGKFDVVICCEVLEHIKDDKKFLDNLHAIDTKYYLISVPAKQKWFDQFDVKVGHFRRYEKKDLLDLLNDTGYQAIKFYSYGYPFINLTRLVRKALAKRVKHHDSIKEKTKGSGVNPIKVEGLFNKVKLAAIIKPLYLFSLIFNNFDLSEGYLVLCQKKK